MCESPSGTDNAVGIERGVGVSEVHAEAIATTRSKIVVIASSRTFMSRIIHGGVCVNAIDKPLEWVGGLSRQWQQEGLCGQSAPQGGA